MEFMPEIDNHTHSWVWITGRMEVKCRYNHWHEVQEGYDFEACPCGKTRGEKLYKCDLPYWYFITEYYCPQCGGGETFKERRFTPKPLAWTDRHELIEAWDYCDI